MIGDTPQQNPTKRIWWACNNLKTPLILLGAWSAWFYPHHGRFWSMAMSLGTKVIRHVPSMDWFTGKPLLDFTKLRGGSIVYFPIIEFCPFLGSKVNPQYISITDGYIILSMYYHVVSPLNPITFGPPSRHENPHRVGFYWSSSSSTSSVASEPSDAVFSSNSCAEFGISWASYPLVMSKYLLKMAH